MKKEDCYESFSVTKRDGSVQRFEVLIPDEYVKNGIRSKDDFVREMHVLNSKINKYRLKLENPYFIKKAPIDIVDKSKAIVNSLIEKKEILIKEMEAHGF